MQLLWLVRASGDGVACKYMSVLSFLCFKEDFREMSLFVSNTESSCRLGTFAAVPPGFRALQQKCWRWMVHVVRFVLFQQWRYQEMWVGIWAEGRSFSQHKIQQSAFPSGRVDFGRRNVWFPSSPLSLCFYVSLTLDTLQIFANECWW